jgi:uncharacterized protein YdbL (DUF1318 family)
MKPYLTLVETSYCGRPWVYAKASEQLIIMLPRTQDGRYVGISQSRPAFQGRVLSPVMGTFHETNPHKMLITAAQEIKSETGHECIDVRFVMTIARSSGLTDETAHVYSAVVSNEAGEQELHNEDINVAYFNSKEEIAQAMQWGWKDGYVIDSSFPLFLLLGDHI